MPKLKSAVGWLDEHFEETILIILLLMITILAGMQVVMRKIFHNPLTWSEELCRFCFVWSGFWGISYSIRRQCIIRITTVVTMVPPAVRKGMNVIADLVSLVFFAFFFTASMETIKKVAASGQVSPALGIPISILYLGAMLGFLFAILRVVQSLYQEFRAGDGKRESPKEEENVRERGN